MLQLQVRLTIAVQSLCSKIRSLPTNVVRIDPFRVHYLHKKLAIPHPFLIGHSLLRFDVYSTRSIHYCSRPCQRQHWIMEHKDSCAYMAARRAAEHSDLGSIHTSGAHSSMYGSSMYVASMMNKSDHSSNYYLPLNVVELD